MDIRYIYVCVIGLFSLVFGGNAYAQNILMNENLKYDVKQYCDSISTLRKQIYSDSIRDCNISPQLYKLLSPSIYYRKTINDYLKIKDNAISRKLEIARALASHPSILCLDEPAAGMNPIETEELMETIKIVREKFNTAILLIEHDMKLVMGICEWIKVISFGKEIATGTPAEIKNNKEVIAAYLGD